MLAGEIKTENREEFFKSKNYFIEEKLDGLRLQVFCYPSNMIRTFSRRISKVTGWFAEDTDLVPHIRDYKDTTMEQTIVGEVDGRLIDYDLSYLTILDGEAYIPNKPFKAVSSTLNCLPEEAVKRQEELGEVCVRVFDIRMYKGVNIEKVPLHRRKYFLEKYLKELNSPYLKMHPYYDLATPGFNAEAFYMKIIKDGGEGIILKDKSGRYRDGHRGKEYLKVKGILTRECILLDYKEPTKEYNGKFPNNRWDYWVDDSGKKLSHNYSADKLLKDGCKPVSKHWFKDWVGNLVFGVFITEEEISKLPLKEKSFDFHVSPFDKSKLILEVGECSGMSEEDREYITDNWEALRYSVVEIEANEIFKDTGRFRHPRFLRLREDKSIDECTWKNHIGEISKEYTLC